MKPYKIVPTFKNYKRLLGMLEELRQEGFNTYGVHGAYTEVDNLPCYDYLVFPCFGTEEARRKTQLDDKVQEILAGIDKNTMSDVDIALYLHDYICANTVQHNYDRTEVKAYNVLVQEAYNMSDDFAETYEFLLRKVGIPSKKVCIKGFKEGYWNQIFVDGNWYNVDVWLDTTANVGTQQYGKTNHRAFLSSDADFYKVKQFRDGLSFDSDTPCQDTRHDKDWWDTIKTELCFKNGAYYYITKSKSDNTMSLMQRKNNKETTLQTFACAVQDIEMVSDRVDYANGKLFWTDGTRVYSWIIDSAKKPAVVFELSGNQSGTKVLALTKITANGQTLLYKVFNSETDYRYDFNALQTATLSTL